MTLRIDIDPDRLAAFCERWHVVELAAFGSVLRDDFHAGSDVDFLVVFAEEYCPTLFGLVEMQEELTEIIGRRVDLSTRRSVEGDHNRRRSREILGSAEVVHAAA